LCRIYPPITKLPDLTVLQTNTTYGKYDTIGLIMSRYPKQNSSRLQLIWKNVSIFFISCFSQYETYGLDTAHPSLFRASDRPRSMIDTPLFFLSLCIRLSVCLYISLYGLNHNGFPRWRVLYIPHMSRSCPSHTRIKVNFFQKYVYFLKGQFHRIF